MATAAEEVDEMMIGLKKLVLVETKLLIRNPAWIFTIGIPLFSILVFGLPVRANDPTADLRGLAATTITISAALVAVYMVPVTLATYRERGILRRFATTPLNPLTLLIVQLLLHLGLLILAAVLLMGIARLVLAIAWPERVVDYVAILLLGGISLFSIGLIIAAIAPGGAAANGIGVLLFFPMAFLAGLMLPKEMMPERIARLGEFTPLGAFRQTLQDAWMGSSPEWSLLLVMILFAVVVVAAAARLFRWE